MAREDVEEDGECTRWRARDAGVHVDPLGVPSDMFFYSSERTAVALLSSVVPLAFRIALQAVPGGIGGGEGAGRVVSPRGARCGPELCATPPLPAGGGMAGSGPSWCAQASMADIELSNPRTVRTTRGVGAWHGRRRGRRAWQRWRLVMGGPVGA